jgi:hypothetical protein
VVKKGNAGEEVEEAEHKLAWIDRQLREEEQRRKQAEQVTQFRAKEKDAVKQGKKHYYPKKCKHIHLSLFQCERTPACSLRSTVLW